MCSARGEVTNVHTAECYRGDTAADKISMLPSTHASWRLARTFAMHGKEGCQGHCHVPKAKGAQPLRPHPLLPLPAVCRSVIQCSATTWRNLGNTTGSKTPAPAVTKNGLATKIPLRRYRGSSRLYFSGLKLAVKSKPQFLLGIPCSRHRQVEGVGAGAPRSWGRR